MTIHYRQLGRRGVWEGDILSIQSEPPTWEMLNIVVLNNWLSEWASQPGRRRQAERDAIFGWDFSKQDHRMKNAPLWSWIKTRMGGMSISKEESEACEGTHTPKFPIKNHWFYTLTLLDFFINEQLFTPQSNLLRPHFCFSINFLLPISASLHSCHQSQPDIGLTLEMSHPCS